MLNAVGKYETLRQEKKANVFCPKLGDDFFVSIEVEKGGIGKLYTIAACEVSGDDTMRLSGIQ